MMKELSESRIVTAHSVLGRLAGREIADMAFLYLCAIRICLIEDQEWARNYLLRTTMWGDYTKWRSNGNDLYVLLHGLYENKDDLIFPLDRKVLHLWMMQAKQGHENEPMTRRIFVRLDHDLLIRDATMKSMRRLIMDWPTLTDANQKIAMTRLLQLYRRKLRRAEILPRLEKLARKRDLEIEDAVDPDSITENASAGATGAASVAGVVGALGVGFDPNGMHRSIYGKDKTKTEKKQKPLVIRR